MCILWRFEKIKSSQWKREETFLFQSKPGSLFCPLHFILSPRVTTVSAFILSRLQQSPHTVSRKRVPLAHRATCHHSLMATCSSCLWIVAVHIPSERNLAYHLRGLFRAPSFWSRRHLDTLHVLRSLILHAQPTATSLSVSIHRPYLLISYLLGKKIRLFSSQPQAMAHGGDKTRSEQIHSLQREGWSQRGKCASPNRYSRWMVS